jgi:hypothetical protein
MARCLFHNHIFYCAWTLQIFRPLFFFPSFYRCCTAPTTSSCQCTTMHKRNASILFVVFVLIALIALSHTVTSGTVVTGFEPLFVHHFALPQRVAATICVDFVALVVLVEKVVARPPWHSSWPTARLSPCHPGSVRQSRSRTHRLAWTTWPSPLGVRC